MGLFVSAVGKIFCLGGTKSKVCDFSFAVCQLTCAKLIEARWGAVLVERWQRWQRLLGERMSLLNAMSHWREVPQWLRVLGKQGARLNL